MKFLSSLLMVILVSQCTAVKQMSKSEDVTDEFLAIVMGDWGGVGIPPWTTPFETNTAAAMARVVETHNMQCIFALGDNFYWNGVTDENDRRFKKTFEDIFYQDSLQDIPWYILAGNHDHYGNVTGQIEYSKHSERWNFDHLWYTKEFTFPSFSVTVVMIDTVTLCGNTLFDAEGGQPTGPRSLQDAEDQLQFIHDSLSASKSEYLLVMGHFPVYSIAEHGPTQCLIDRLKPLLEQFEATAYFNGHDHNLQYLKENGVNYFVSGAADVVDPSEEHMDQVPEGSLVYHWHDILGLGGFATVQATAKELRVEFHKASDRGLVALYRTDPILPRKVGKLNL